MSIPSEEARDCERRVECYVAVGTRLRIDLSCRTKTREGIEEPFKCPKELQGCDSSATHCTNLGT